MLYYQVLVLFILYVDYADGISARVRIWQDIKIEEYKRSKKVLEEQAPPVAQVQQGILFGKYERSRKGKQYSAFTGIPFAKAPVDKLRFRAPIPAGPWVGTLDASKSIPLCPQNIQFYIIPDAWIGNEDCLFLNVYTPQSLSSTLRPFPVMFYIFGGAFSYGSADSDWYGADKLMDKDLVLVISNYRLGALGFLSTGDEAVPGNNGLKDLVLALQWVKTNIASFGGDPERITIVGHSSGAILAHLMVLSPLTRGLINRAILQGGTTLCPFFHKSQKTISNSKKLARSLNCPVNSSKMMVECLQKKNVSDILGAQSKIFLEWGLEPTSPLTPVIEMVSSEQSFMLEHPRDIIKSGSLPNITFIIGMNTADGASSAIVYYRNLSWIEDFNYNFDKIAALTLFCESNKKEEFQKLREFYFKNRRIDNSTKDELTKMYTDAIFLVGTDEAIRLHLGYNNHTIYAYLFGYRGSESHNKIFGDVTHNYGTCHGDELLYLFTLKSAFPDYIPNEEDNKMTDALTTLWANFIESGNPTPDANVTLFPKWIPVSGREDLNYFFITGTNDMKMADGLYTENLKFLKALDLYS